MAIPDIKQVTAAVYTVLSGTTAIVAALGSAYSSTAIFTGHVVPSVSTRPYVHIQTPNGLAPFDSKTGRGWDVRFNIVIVSDNDESSKEAIEIADLILEKLHRGTLTLSTNNHLYTNCIGMTPSVSSDDLSALVLSFSVLFVD